MSYGNYNKARRRLDQIMAGELGPVTGEAIGRLSTALEVDAPAVAKAVEESREQLRVAAEERRRAEFVPHAIILTERSVPTQIWLAAIAGYDRLRRIDFDLSQGPSSYLRQALADMNQRLNRHGGVIPTFGKATGLVIAYSVDRRAEFDCNGALVEIGACSVPSPTAWLRF